MLFWYILRGTCSSMTLSLGKAPAGWDTVAWRLASQHIRRQTPPFLHFFLKAQSLSVFLHAPSLSFVEVPKAVSCSTSTKGPNRLDLQTPGECEGPQKPLYSPLSLHCPDVSSSLLRPITQTRAMTLPTLSVSVPSPWVSGLVLCHILHNPGPPAPQPPGCPLLRRTSKE